MVSVTDFIDNRLLIIFIFSIVVFMIYSFIVKDRNNYTDIILSLIAGLLSFITAISIMAGVKYAFGGTSGILTYTYQSQSVGTVFIIIGVIMILIGIVKIYDVVQDASEEIKL